MMIKAVSKAFMLGSICEAGCLRVDKSKALFAGEKSVVEPVKMGAVLRGVFLKPCKAKRRVSRISRSIR
jgi:hypothetical protein